MYRCQDCEKNFSSAKRIYDENTADSPPYEKHLVCPYCESENIGFIKVYHCRCCGARLPFGVTDYCNEKCKKRGQKLWNREQKRKNQLKFDPIYIMTEMVDDYNKKHNTKYSYGQFVALVLPKIIKEEKVNGNRRKENLS